MTPLLVAQNLSCFLEAKGREPSPGQGISCLLLAMNEFDERVVHGRDRGRAAGEATPALRSFCGSQGDELPGIDTLGRWPVEPGSSSRWRPHLRTFSTTPLIWSQIRGSDGVHARGRFVGEKDVRLAAWPRRPGRQLPAQGADRRWRRR